MLELDHRIFYALYGGPSHASAAAFVMIALTVLGSGWSMLGLVPLLVVARTRRVALALTGTLAVTAALVFLGKAAIGRPRPCAALSGVHAIFGAPTDFSLPSGHAAGAFAFAAFVATVILSRSRSVRALAAAGALLALAAGVALSRVYLGCHFPADALAGAVLGGTLGIFGGNAYARRAPTA